MLLHYDGSDISPIRNQKNRGLSSMNTKECQADVQAGIEKDLTRQYRVTDTDAFLKELLPVDEKTVQRIFDDAEVKKLYKNNRWEGFPEGKLLESVLYAPFVKIATAIRVAAEDPKHNGVRSEMGATDWTDYHTTSPKSSDKDGADIRPDILLALNEIKERQAAGQAVDKDEAKIREIIWWLQVVAAVEMKRHDSDDWVELVIQLIGYLRRILREQLDRRFVFGLTLGPEMMTVWMHDRSGVLGTKTSINIHEDPLKFVQVIAAFSLLSPEKLGFDPTMKLVVSPNLAVPSYNPTEKFIDAYRAKAHNRQWVIKMNDGKQYVTVRTVSYVRTGFMRGTGSIVWVVVPYGETDQPSEISVLKQYWRPGDIPSEGDFYKAATGSDSECHHVGKIESFEEVLISGEPDSTDKLIRKSLQTEADPSASSFAGGRKRKKQQEEAKEDQYIHVTCTNLGDIAEVQAVESQPPVWRVRTRVISSTYGWEIKYFSTLRELLTVLRDAIKGHKHLYRNGVLHRDVSPGNILIEWCPGSDADKPSTSGRLIDLDHAKIGKTSVEKEKVSIDNELIDGVHSWMLMSIRKFATLPEGGVDKAVARLSLEVLYMNSSATDPETWPSIPYAVASVKHALAFRRLNQERMWAPAHLLWRGVKEIENRHNFHSDPSELQKKGSRTGTLPYISGAILSREPYFPGPRSNRHKLSHHAVHDLESFFWVLVHICLTRQGPGRDRRQELRDGVENKEQSTLRGVVFLFFDSADTTTLAANKRKLFHQPEDLDTYILANFHEYFQSLKETVKEWFHVLLLAHEHHGFEYHDIHDMIIPILDHAISSMPPDESSPASKKILNDRKSDIEKLQSYSFGQVNQSPPPRRSPSNFRTPLPHPSPPSSPSPTTAKKQRKK